MNLIFNEKLLIADNPITPPPHLLELLANEKEPITTPKILEKLLFCKNYISGYALFKNKNSSLYIN